MSSWSVLPCRTLIIYIMISHFGSSSGERITAHYQVYPEVGLKGLSCLSQNIEFNRAVRFDNTSTICEMLDEAWNRNPVFDTGFIYMQMLLYHKPFRASSDVASYIPEDFQVGNGFDVVFQTVNVPTQRINVMVNYYKANQTFILVQFRPGHNATYLRSELNGEFTNDTIAPLPAFKGNTSYTISVYLQVLQWEVFVEGVPFKNYTHVYPFNNTGDQKVRFKGLDVTCRSIIFR